MLSAKILDVGCGLSKEKGATGLDQFPLPGVDIVCNINQKWPIEDNSYDKIIFRHSICHFDSLETILREAKRVGKKGGVIEIISPHFSSDNAFTDPTMKFSTGYRTLDYYCNNGTTNYGYYGKLGLRIISKKIYLYRAEPKNLKHEIISLILYPVDVIINWMPRFYEKFICFMLRGNEIKYLIEIVD